MPGETLHTSLPDIYLLYVIPILVALLLGVLFPVARHIRDTSQRRQYYLIQVIMLLSGVLRLETKDFV